MRYLLPLCILLLASCSAEKRLQRLVKKHPHLQQTLRVDSAIVLPGEVVERTLVLHDTIRVESERQVVQVVRVPVGSPCDTVPVVLDVRAEVLPDTVTVTVEVDRIVCPETGKVAPWWRTAALVLAVALVVLGWALRRTI